MHRAIELVRPRAVSEQTRDRCFDFALGVGGGNAGPCHELPGKFIRTRRQVFREVIQHLGAVMRTGLRPLFSTASSRDRVTYVLAITLAHFTDDCSRRRMYGPRVTAIRPNLLAADKQLRRTVEHADVTVRIKSGRLRNRLSTLGTNGQLSPRTRLQILVNPLAPAFAAKAGFAISAKANTRIEEIRRVDPDHAALQTRRDIQRA